MWNNELIIATDCLLIPRNFGSDGISSNSIDSDSDFENVERFIVRSRLTDWRMNWVVDCWSGLIAYFGLYCVIATVSSRLKRLGSWCDGSGELTSCSPLKSVCQLLVELFRRATANALIIGWRDELLTSTGASSCWLLWHSARHSQTEVDNKRRNTLNSKLGDVRRLVQYV